MGEEFRLGMGTLCFWGNTPALNLEELISDDGSESNILLLGQCDMRHILKTLTKRKQFDKSLNFYIWEPHPILCARQMLLLKLATLPLDQVGIQSKLLAFTEILGNILVRPQTIKVIEKCCEELIKELTDEKVLAERMPFMSTENLKFKERDMIVEILKYWSKSEKHLSASQMTQLWDGRVRRYLTTRYDNRMGVFDWDYQMRMTEKNPDTKIVHVREYKNWRNLGMAFVEYEADYNQANITLLPYEGSPFHGEILVGPFIPYGIQCEDSSYFEQSNREYNKKSSDLTLRNLEEIFNALSPSKVGNVCRAMANIKIRFLPIDACESLWKKSKFLGQFDTVYCSNHSGHKIKPELVKLMASTAKVIVEQSMYIWYFRNENDEAYSKKVIELGESSGLKLQSGDKAQLVFGVVDKTSSEDKNGEDASNVMEDSGGAGDSGGF